MYAMNVRDVNEALPAALFYLLNKGEREETRNGPAIVAPEPVATVYRYPRQRVLFDPARDANPFFHLFESLWILAGQQDVKFLSWFNSRIAQYSDDGVNFHAPYGYRLRRHFGFDQIEAACDMLRKDYGTRRAVLQIWDAKVDLSAPSKDIPCNDTILLRVRQAPESFHESKKVLDLTVCNRSNDAVWGAYGANAVQFSMLQEYMAESIGVGVGVYTQLSHNLHVYDDNPYWVHWLKHRSMAGVTVSGYEHPKYITADPLLNKGETIDGFNLDLQMMFNIARNSESLRVFEAALHRVFCSGDSGVRWQTRFFEDTVHPMLRKFVHREPANYEPGGFRPWESDWHLAGKEWLERRAAKRTAAALNGG